MGKFTLIIMVVLMLSATATGGATYLVTSKIYYRLGYAEAAADIPFGGESDKQYVSKKQPLPRFYEIDGNQ